MNAVILCGGLSTRLGEITKNIPKILLEIGDKTILDWQLTKLKQIGIKEVVLAAGHLAHILEKEIGFERLGIEIIYAIEDKRLGTGGAIKHGLEYVLHPEDPTFILNGDILYTIDFADMVSKLKSDSDGIILASHAPDIASYGTLVYDENLHLKEFKEKEGKHIPGYQNGGLYLFNPSAKKYFPQEDQFSIEYDVFPNMKDLYVYQSDKPWVDVGLPERLDWAKEHWREFI